MKSGLIWPYIASVAVHATILVAVSWLQVNAATTPARAGYVEVSFLEADHESPREGALNRATHWEGEAPAEPRRIVKAIPDNNAEIDVEEVSVPVEQNEAVGKYGRASGATTRGDGASPSQSPLVKAISDNTADNDVGDSSEPVEKDEAVDEYGRGAAGASPSQAAIELSGPEIVRVVEPQYPRLARREGHEGRVVVDAAILSNGRVGEVAIIESSGHDELDAAAAKAAEKSRFSPATRAGVPIDSSKRLLFRFVLEDK